MEGVDIADWEGEHKLDWCCRLDVERVVGRGNRVGEPLICLGNGRFLDDWVPGKWSFSIHDIYPEPVIVAMS